MKFALEGDQRHFFRKHHLLEVEGLISKSQLQEFNTFLKTINKDVEKDLTSQKTLKFKTSDVLFNRSIEIFLNGRDLSRLNDYAKKFILNPQFAEIAADLIASRPLRFGFDQLYPTVSPPLKDKKEFNPYQIFKNKTVTLKEISSLQGVLCGLMICLSAPELKEEDSEKPLSKESVFSKKAGNAVFFDPEALIPFDELISEEEALYMLIVYTHKNAIYYLENADPQTHRLKHLGYVFGDRLNDKLNPILFR